MHEYHGLLSFGCFDGACLSSLVLDNIWSIRFDHMAKSRTFCWICASYNTTITVPVTLHWLSYKKKKKGGGGVTFFAKTINSLMFYQKINSYTQKCCFFQHVFKQYIHLVRYKPQILQVIIQIYTDNSIHLTRAWVSVCVSVRGVKMVSTAHCRLRP